MKPREVPDTVSTGDVRRRGHVGQTVTALLRSPSGGRAVLRYLAVLSHPWVKYLLGLVGLVVQMVLVVLTWELVQVCASIAEMWVALARKYLEISG